MSYNPFINSEFQSDICFLSGEKSVEEKRPVFPLWIIERYQLSDKYMTMLNGQKVKYTDLVLPVSLDTAQALDILDNDTETAFTKGYEGVQTLSELRLFQWIARITYGVLYNDLSYEISNLRQAGQPFQLSSLMNQKLKNLHLLLQSLIVPTVFEGFTPWSISVFPVNYSKDVFNYKDETHKLNFCIGMNGFGMIACLQDNGCVRRHEKEIIDKIYRHTLHPIQFEEMYGRFLYANYLLREFPDYTVRVENKTHIISLPALEEIMQDEYRLFDKWDDSIFAQVLAKMWEPWGIQMKDIHDFPNAPVSFLIDERTYTFIEPPRLQWPN